MGAGGIYVQCSDGLYSVVDEAEIAEAVAQRTPESACECLVGLANARGGPDNISVQVIQLR